MPSYYFRNIVTPPSYLVNDPYQVQMSQGYHSFPYNSDYQQSSHYRQENMYNKPFGYMNPYENGSYGFKNNGPASSMRGVGSYSSNGTTFFMPNIPVDHGDFVSKNQQYYQQQQPPVQHHQENVTGGVSATLDYDLDDMSEFVSNMAIGIMGPYSTQVKSERPTQEFLDAFHKFTNQVLVATRLPKATVILALVYLSKRWALGNIPTAESNVPVTYNLLVVALLLANKFHDDNTFTNKSWNEATGVPVRDLNMIERDWLKSIQWSLHLNQNDRKGWEKWNDCWEYWVASRRKSAASPPSSYHSVSDFSDIRHSKNVARDAYPSPVHSPESSNISSRQSSPVESTPSYTIPNWYVNSNSKANPSFGSRTRPMSSSMGRSSDQFVSYFQQSFVGNRPEEKYSNYGMSGHNHNHSSSYFVPAYGAASCNCNYCSFDSAPQFSKWYSGGCATAC